ncbi:cytochrome b5 domain-containing protein 1 [Latimeria chalumnae]|uniref:Cytochrome b5 domain-containing protein 1 n=1 Tax=Latimeria chalumnae TaxID=7897 RepID=H3AGT9_LATCH|nr:PREDICTED: cytochrome b5 domain-containing protein 1 [Latimeria chalumnae]|eukprot:XP_005997956.1 PREDICTED: cytochrome b5 domain-containing protein 1 [Latimeria chalumnae]
MPRRKYYSAKEVGMHNILSDIWVSYLGKVYDLTPLVQHYKGDVLLKPIVEAAGKDISHWFDPKTKDIRTHVDPLTGCEKYFTPNGRFIHIPPPCPRTDWSNVFGRPWWMSIQYEIGILSAKTRVIRIINTLTSQEQFLEVCSEETISEILQRYLYYNAHAASYTWKYDGVNLDMEKTLEQNGIPDEDEEFYELSMDADRYTSAIHLYFNDDLTEF